MKKQTYIECSKGDSTSCLKFPTEMLGKIEELLCQHNYKLKFDDLNKAKNFLRRVTPFMMTSFYTYLHKQVQYKEIRILLQNLKKQKDSKQQKFELNDARDLLKQDTSKKFLFLQAFEEFLKSSYLVDYIQNNKKVQTEFNKRLYLKTRSLFLKEIKKGYQGEKIFMKFISDKNAKEVKNFWFEIKEELGGQIYQSPSPISFTPEESELSVEVKSTQEIFIKNINNSEDIEQYQICQFESSLFLPKNGHSYYEDD